MNHHESEPRRIGIVPRIVAGATTAIAVHAGFDATHQNTAQAEENIQQHSLQIDRGSGGFLGKDDNAEFSYSTLGVLVVGSAILVGGGMIARRDKPSDNKKYPKKQQTKKKARKL